MKVTGHKPLLQFWEKDLVDKHSYVGKYGLKPTDSYDKESKKILEDQTKFMDKCETRNKECSLYMKKSQRFIKKINKLVGKILEEGKLSLNYRSRDIQTSFTSYKRAIFHLAEVDKQPPKEYWKRLKSQIIYEAEKPYRQLLILKHMLKKWPRV